MVTVRSSFAMLPPPSSQHMIYPTQRARGKIHPSRTPVIPDIHRVVLRMNQVGWDQLGAEQDQRVFVRRCRVKNAIRECFLSEGVFEKSWIETPIHHTRFVIPPQSCVFACTLRERPGVIIDVRDLRIGRLKRAHYLIIFLRTIKLHLYLHPILGDPR